MEWIFDNLSTIIVGLLLAISVAAVIIYMVKIKRSGKNILSCGGNCDACGLSGSCDRRESPEKKNK